MKITQGEMIKKFNAVNNELTDVIYSLITSLQCEKYRQVADRIEFCLPDAAIFKKRDDKEIVEKGFGSCLLKSYGIDNWEVSIIVNIKNCQQAKLTPREITAVILHELGHILNVPDLPDEPTFEFCFIHGIPFDHALLEQVQESNNLAREMYADSYAMQHGYGAELITTFHRQNENFDQKIGFCQQRIEQIQNPEWLGGKTISIKGNF
ncbi:MAG: hypothetical protein KF763_15470 [Cyclobacteriaceae bacterium]|nr:hypothetical protein [Cyclobacteriaceae bacterium]